MIESCEPAGCMTQYFLMIWLQPRQTMMFSSDLELTKIAWTHLWRIDLPISTIDYGILRAANMLSCESEHNKDVHLGTFPLMTSLPLNLNAQTSLYCSTWFTECISAEIILDCSHSLLTAPAVLRSAWFTSSRDRQLVHKHTRLFAVITIFQSWSEYYLSVTAVVLYLVKHWHSFMDVCINYSSSSSCLPQTLQRKHTNSPLHRAWSCAWTDYKLK